MKTAEQIIREAQKLKFNYKFSDEWLLDIVRITREECIKVMTPEAKEIHLKAQYYADNESRSVVENRVVHRDYAKKDFVAGAEWIKSLIISQK